MAPKLVKLRGIASRAFKRWNLILCQNWRLFPRAFNKSRPCKNSMLVTVVWRKSPLGSENLNFSRNLWFVRVPCWKHCLQKFAALNPQKDWRLMTVQIYTQADCHTIKDTQMILSSFSFSSFRYTIQLPFLDITIFESKFCYFYSVINCRWFWCSITWKTSISQSRFRRVEIFFLFRFVGGAIVWKRKDLGRLDRVQRHFCT